MIEDLSTIMPYFIKNNANCEFNSLTYSSEFELKYFSQETT